MPETEFYPFPKHLQNSPTTCLCPTPDGTSHLTEYRVVQLGLAIDGVSLPVGFTAMP